MAGVYDCSQLPLCHDLFGLLCIDPQQHQEACGELIDDDHYRGQDFGHIVDDGSEPQCKVRILDRRISLRSDLTEDQDENRKNTGCDPCSGTSENING